MTCTVLVTGAAGFIGAEVVLRLLAQGKRVIGLDNLNHYYNPELKRARLAGIASSAQAFHGHWTFAQLDLEDGE